MNIIFDIASNIATPLALGGFFAAIFFFLIKQIIAKNIFPKLTEALSSEIIKLIINYVFILSLIAMILGFIGYLIPKLPEKNLFITGNVYFSDGKPVKDATVFVEGVDRSKVTDSTGWFKIEVNEQKSYYVKALYKEKTIQTELKKDNINLPIRLTFAFTESNPDDFNKKVALCLKNKIENQLVKSFSQPGSVRCPGGGCLFQSGSCNKREARPSYTAPSEYHITNYKLIQGATDDGITGQVQETRDGEGRVTAISVYIACDPADTPGAGGGWNEIKLEGEISHINPDILRNRYLKTCEDEVKSSYSQ